MENKYLKESIVNKGNQFRLKNCMKRARIGEKVTIGYLGGSITMGSVATAQEKCYAYLSHLWWKEKFPQAEIGFVNAGIGATTSQFGVARVEEDLLKYDPDVVFIEFSVNDSNSPHFKETFEGLVRRVYGSDAKPAVVILHNAFYDDGHSAEEIHGEIGRYYDIPCVSFKSSVVARVLNGDIEALKITPDNLHPNDTGHAMLAENVKYFLDSVYKKVDVEEPDKALPEKTVTRNRYENSKRMRNENLDIRESMGFVKDTSIQSRISDVFKNGWEVREEGAFLEFDVEAACLAIQYRRTIHHPAASLKVLVDGEETAILNGEFDKTWGNLIALDTIYEKDTQESHRVRLELVNVHENDVLPFYLVSVIVS